ncbi:Cytochrome P450 monooxygenase 124 [Psilocybe cubensis]|uniref:Cytochrome P450 monooxygenase 124 n=1 Tax=Psilocybe cubensis TaxID=181762 RepID=A0ACB8GFY4_PSICU|nr:Cytochrome P450 monooxygenase 124 [Psilocybe cubensis]KAH9474466.1 Cytochrome P450 monooxygenase 124 [Psilocybe cubensis]
MFLPKIKYFTAGSNHGYEDKHEKFAAAGCDVYVTVHALPNPQTTIYLADAALIKEVTNNRAKFPKPVHHYGVLSFYGDNIVASEGEQWKKYRKIAAPAFSERNYSLVWDETLDIVRGLCDDHWKGRETVEVDNFVDIALAMTLYVISGAGFGKKISWKDDTELPEGHLMSFKDSMRVVTADITLKIACPDWMMNFTKRLRRAKLAFKELREYMVEMIEERQKSDNTNRHDLFTGLLRENKSVFESSMLTDDELIGKTYLAETGRHATTGHTLAFTFGLLALYPEAQDKVLAEIRSIVPDGKEPSYSDMNRMRYTLALLNESMRMHPVITHIPKTPFEDTTLVTTNANGEKVTVPVPAGTDINILTAGLHYNPRYWDDPHTFKPERFLKDWPRDAFMPFSAGPRACLGRKFFETEAIATVVMLVSRYKITVMEEPKFAGETFEQRKARVMACDRYITTVPTKIPLVFTRRT